MRKKIVTILLVALIIGLLSIVEQRAVDQLSTWALAETVEIAKLLRAGELEEGLEKSRALDQAWDEGANRLELMIDHSATDDVRYALSKLIAALEGDERGMALIYAGELEGSLEHVKERQAFSAQNLF